MNRNYFQFLRNKKFSLLQKDFNKYLVELYFKESNYKPVDKNEYNIQNQLLLKENKDLWEVYKDNLINDIQNYSKNNQKYLNRSTENATSYFKYLNNI